MTLQIPENLRKYVSIDESEDIIDRFVCPVDGCEFTTRLGPGAIRMHMLMKSDPLTAVYEKNHEEFFRLHHEELTVNSVKELAQVPFRTVTYKKK